MKLASEVINPNGKHLLGSLFGKGSLISIGFLVAIAAAVAIAICVAKKRKNNKGDNENE